VAKAGAYGTAAHLYYETGEGLETLTDGPVPWRVEDGPGVYRELMLGICPTTGATKAVETVPGAPDRDYDTHFPPDWLTGTADLVIVQDGAVYVEDLKTGKPEAARDNPQLLTLAYIAAVHYGASVATICIQNCPRYSSSYYRGKKAKSPQWRDSADYSLDDLTSWWYNLVLPAIQVATTSAPQENTAMGPACFFCDAKYDCEKYLDKNPGARYIQLRRREISAEKEEEENIMALKPGSYIGRITDAELGVATRGKNEGSQVLRVTFDVPNAGTMKHTITFAGDDKAITYRMKEAQYLGWDGKSASTMVKQILANTGEVAFDVEEVKTRDGRSFSAVRFPFEAPLAPVDKTGLRNLDNLFAAASAAATSNGRPAADDDDL
jgi:hypothetical protein